MQNAEGILDRSGSDVLRRSVGREAASINRPKTVVTSPRILDAFRHPYGARRLAPVHLRFASVAYQVCANSTPAQPLHFYFAVIKTD